ncbi:hypothetical protein KR222_002053, partial [Zaprionus bogoriensis]
CCRLEENMDKLPHLKEKPSNGKTKDTQSTKDTFDELICSIGQFGCFQINNFLMLCLPIICHGLYTFSYIFTASGVQQRCSITQCDNENSSYIEPFLNFTIPQDEDESWDECEQFEAISGSDSHCSPLSFNTSSRVDCQAGYKYRDEENTISTEFEIACSDQWKLTMVGSASKLGQVVGVILGGYYSDRFGRKSVLVVSGTLTAVSGIIQSHAPNYLTFVVFEFLNLVLCSTLFPTALLLAVEYVSMQHRVKAGLFIYTTHCVSSICLAVSARYTMDWRLLLRVIYTPALMHLVLICVLPESVRWLLSQERQQEAFKLLEKAARMNERKVPEELLLKCIHENRHLEAQSKKTDDMQSVRNLYNALGLRIAQCSFVWFSNGFISLGLVINAGNIGGSKFENFTLMWFLNLPASLIALFLMQCIGRRWTMCLAFSACAVGLLGTSILFGAYPTLSRCIYYIAFFATVGGTYNLNIFTTEMMPTNYRNRLYSFCAMVGLGGCVLAPQTILLEKYHKFAAFYLFIVIAILGTVITLYLPETTNKVLPSTLEEASAMDCSFPLSKPLEDLPDNKAV